MAVGDAPESSVLIISTALVNPLKQWLRISPGILVDDGLSQERSLHLLQELCFARIKQRFPRKLKRDFCDSIQIDQSFRNFTVSVVILKKVCVTKHKTTKLSGLQYIYV